MLAVMPSTLLTVLDPVVQMISTLLVIPLTAIALHSKVVTSPNSAVSILVTCTTGLGTVNKRKMYEANYLSTYVTLRSYICIIYAYF